MSSIADIQRRINQCWRHFKIPGEKLVVDGEYGLLTAAAIRKTKLCFGYKPRYAHGLVDQAFRRRLVRPLSAAHPIQVARGLRYRRRLRRAAKVKLRERAYRVASGLVGVMEQGGNNQGPMVSKIIRANGGTGPEPWCGNFVAYCYRLAGSRAVERLWASVRWLGRLSGLRKTKTPQRGDLVRFTFDHVGMFVRDLGNGYIETIEGNTSQKGAVSDSMTGGDGVYRKHRPHGVVLDYLAVRR